MVAATLAEEAIALAQDHGGQFGGLDALRAEAKQQPEERSIAVVARNAVGKTTFVDTLITLTLDDEATYCRASGEDVELPPPVAALVEEGQTLELAVEGGQLVAVYNPDPSRNTDHLQRGWRRFFGYSSGNRGRFKDSSTLLRVGDSSSQRTTTQVLTRVSVAPVVSCLFRMRGPEKLAEVTADTFQWLVDQASDDATSDFKLTKDPEFKYHCRLLEKLTGEDVLVLHKQHPEKGLESVLAGLWQSAERRAQQAQQVEQAVRARRADEHGQQEPFNGDRRNPEIGAALLRRELELTARLLKHTAFIGTRDSRSSDLAFVKDALYDPLLAVLNACSRRSEVPLTRAELQDPEIEGMLLEAIEVTVPCQALGAVVLCDIPGLDDSKPWANFHIKQALRSADDVICVVDRGLGAESVLLNFLLDSGWLTDKVSNKYSDSRLTVMWNSEKFAVMMAENVWSWEEQGKSAKVHAESRDVLREALKQHMTGPDSDALVDDFVDRRTECVSSFPVNYFCTALETTAKLFEDLSDAVDGVASLNPVSVFKEFVKRTRVADLLGLLRKLGMPGELRKYRALQAEVDRQLASLSDGDATWLPAPEAAKQVVEQLELKVNRPLSLNTWVNAAKEFQVGSGTRRQAALEAAQLAGGSSSLPRNRDEVRRELQEALKPHFDALAERYRELLSDANIESYASDVVAALEVDGITMVRIGRLCKSKGLDVAGLADVFGPVRGALFAATASLMNERRQQLVQAHQAAASGAARLLMAALGFFVPDEGAAQFLGVEQLWRRQLLGRIEGEILGVAERNMLDARALNNRLRKQLCQKLGSKLRDAYDNRQKPTRNKSTFLTPALKNAVMDGLRALRGELPAMLEAERLAHVADLFADSHLFLCPRNASHGLVRIAGTLKGGTSQELVVQPAVTQDTGAASAGGRLNRLQRYQQQACLWLAGYRFLKNSVDTLTSQDVANAEARRTVQERLRALHARLERALKERSGAAQPDFVDQLGCSLAHTMLQRASMARVAAASTPTPELAALRPMEIPDVALASDGATCRLLIGSDFVATAGDLRLPAAQEVDAPAALHELQAALQAHLKLQVAELAVAAGQQHNNALEASYAAMCGRKPGATALAQVREIVVREMAEKSEPDMKRLLERAGLGGEQPIEYIYSLADNQRHAGLLEVHHLAEGFLPPDVGFLVFTARRQEGEQGPRFRAFHLPGAPLRLGRPAKRTLKALPLLATAQRVGGLPRYLLQPLAPLAGDRGTQPAREDSTVAETLGEARRGAPAPPDAADQAGPSNRRPSAGGSDGVGPSKRRRVS